MTDLWISLAVFAVIFGGALVGALVRPLLSKTHLHSDSKDLVKMATGLIGTLAALVLGLLIASAKSSFDQKTTQVRQMTATVILLDDLLAEYGPEAAPVRAEFHAQPGRLAPRDREAALWLAERLDRALAAFVDLSIRPAKDLTFTRL
jgi:hypothetical protein